MKNRRHVAASASLWILLIALIASEAWSTPIRADNAGRLARVATLPVQGSFINALFFSPDGETLVSGDRNGEVSLWSAGTWSRHIFLPGESTLAKDAQARVAFWGTLAQTADGQMILRAFGDDGRVAGYALDGREVFSAAFGARVYALDVSPDGSYLAVAGVTNRVLIFDLHLALPAAEIVTDHEYILNLDFSPDGRTLLGACERPDNVLKMWSVATWREIASSTPTAERIDYHDALYAPGGREIIVGVRPGATDDAEIQFLDAVTWERTREFADPARAPYQLAVSPDGTLLASAGDDGTVWLWNLATYAPARVLSPGGEVGAVAFSPDGALLAFSIWERGIEVWAVAP